jgi:hypothetical protein
VQARTQFLGLLAASGLAAAEPYTPPRLAPFDRAPHHYWDRTPTDRFFRAMARVERGEAVLDARDERALLRSLLRLLELDDSTQLLVYSATSLQSAIIHPRNPRALYFNEDTSLGYVPGGRFEVASFDPILGMNFYLFDRASDGQVPRFHRSDRCMNCHADTPSGRVPGFVLHSLAVSDDGYSLETYRYDQTGHHVPLSLRFGGWHLTGGHRLPETHANQIARLSPQGLQRSPNPPGRSYDPARYPRATSDILAHLVHEHQAGLLNRIALATYLGREAEGKEAERAADLEACAADLADYLLFRGEAALPKGGIAGDPDFIRDFQARASGPAAVLREFDLRTRMFRHRLSYLAFTPVWEAVPPSVARRVASRLRAAWAADKSDGAGLTGDEGEAILRVLRALRPEWLPEESGLNPNPGTPLLP